MAMTVGGDRAEGDAFLLLACRVSLLPALTAKSARARCVLGVDGCYVWARADCARRVASSGDGKRQVRWHIAARAGSGRALEIPIC